MEPTDPENESAPTKKPSDSISFEVDDFDRYLVDEMIPNSSVPGRWAAISAVRHTNRAWKLREADPEMAMFRAITGEEEAATALFRTLKRLNYKGADKLKPRDHRYKNSVTPFFAAVWDLLLPALQRVAPRGHALQIDRSAAKPRIVVKLKTTISGVDYEAEPVPPLRILVEQGEFRPDGTIDPATAKPADLGQKIAEHAASSGAANVKTFLMDRANLRNRVLYASKTGYPEVKPPIDGPLRLLRRNTFLILKVFLLVDGYEEEQSFARQCLLSFLRLVDDPATEVSFE